MVKECIRMSFYFFVMVSKCSRILFLFSFFGLCFVWKEIGITYNPHATQIHGFYIS